MFKHCLPNILLLNLLYIYIHLVALLHKIYRRTEKISEDTEDKDKISEIQKNRKCLKHIQHRNIEVYTIKIVLEKLNWIFFLPLLAKYRLSNETEMTYEAHTRN